MKKIFLLAFCLSALLWTSCEGNDKEEQPGTKEHAEEMNDDQLPDSMEDDSERILDIYSCNLLEIRMSEQATGKATTSEVKNLATMMVQAHTKMDKDLTALAGRKNITLPTDLTPEHRRQMEQLGEKSGLAYDKRYSQEMKDKHQDAEKKLQKLADDASDPEVKQWASSSLAEIRAHLDMVNATLGNVKEVKKEVRNNKDHTHDGKDDIH